MRAHDHCTVVHTRTYILLYSIASPHSAFLTDIMIGIGAAYLSTFFPHKVIRIEPDDLYYLRTAMSWEQRRFHGRWETGRYPLVEPRRTNPDPTVAANVQEAVEKPGALGETGERTCSIKLPNILKNSLHLFILCVLSLIIST